MPRSRASGGSRSAIAYAHGTRIAVGVSAHRFSSARPSRADLSARRSSVDSRAAPRHHPGGTRSDQPMALCQQKGGGGGGRPRGPPFVVFEPPLWVGCVAGGGGKSPGRGGGGEA